MTEIRRYKDKDKVLVAVDCIIFGFDPNEEELKLLVIKRHFQPEKGNWSLIGGFLFEEETLASAANRVLHKLTGLHDVYMQQLSAFSELDRDPGARTISVVYYSLVNVQDIREDIQNEYSATWFKISERPELIFDHNIMIHMAISQLRHKASIEPIGFELLPEKFTMRQLQKLYEEIYCEELDKRNFSKKMSSLNVLERLDEKDMQSSKKGSFLYMFDPYKYRNQKNNGFLIKQSVSI